jgi:hypothetical protein
MCYHTHFLLTTLIDGSIFMHFFNLCFPFLYIIADLAYVLLYVINTQNKVINIFIIVSYNVQCCCFLFWNINLSWNRSGVPTEWCLDLVNHFRHRRKYRKIMFPVHSRNYMHTSHHNLMWGHKHSILPRLLAGCCLSTLYRFSYICPLEVAIDTTSFWYVFIFAFGHS